MRKGTGRHMCANIYKNWQQASQLSMDQFDYCYYDTSLKQKRKELKQNKKNIRVDD